MKQKKNTTFLLLILIVLVVANCAKKPKKTEDVSTNKETLTSLNNKYQTALYEIEQALKDNETDFTDLMEANYDFCSNDTLLLKKEWYNTELGTAFFYLPLPIGTKLDSLKINIDTKKKLTIATFNCVKGSKDVFDGNYRMVPRFINKLLIAPHQDAKLHIIVDYSSLKDHCTTKDIKFTKRKKGSIVEGSPFIGTENLK